MTSSSKKAQADIAKLMSAACVPRGYLEELHAGFTPVTRSGDYSDVLPRYVIASVLRTP